MFGESKMKKHHFIGELIYFFAFFCIFLFISSSLAYVDSNVNISETESVDNTENDIVFDNMEITITEHNAISMIDELIEKILDSPIECWKNQANQTKNAIINKLTSLKELIRQENFDGAYNKMLHDIKPKLTGLKTNENEEPWGNGTFKQAWVLCEDLREEFRVDCNNILNNLIPPLPN